LPHKYCIQDPVLLYSSKLEGFSLTRFLSKASEHSPAFLLIHTMNDDIFGAFVTSPFETGHALYYGSRDCFLWTFLPKPHKYGWNETHETDYMILVTSKFLQIGGGVGIGLWLDQELYNGRTEKCSTFQNEPLTKEGNSEFLCKSFELFGLK